MTKRLKHTKLVIDYDTFEPLIKKCKKAKLKSAARKFRVFKYHPELVDKILQKEMTGLEVWEGVAISLFINRRHVELDKDVIMKDMQSRGFQFQVANPSLSVCRTIAANSPDRKDGSFRPRGKNIFRQNYYPPSFETGKPNPTTYSLSKTK